MLEKQQFQNQGYLLVKDFFKKSDAIAAADWLRSQDLKSLAKTWTDQEPGVELAVYQNIHTGDTPIAKLSREEKVLNLAHELMGDKVYIWSSKVNLKAAWCGTVEYYHQDYVYWKDRGYEKIDMLSCMIFLDPHGVQNGGLNVIPGSHKYDFIEHVPFINTNGLSKFMIPPEKMDRLFKEHGRVVIEAEPGDVLFFHAGLVHGSAHNISEQPRMVILSQLNVEGNLPADVAEKARQFNLQRAQMELKEAERRYAFFKEKYEKQLKSQTLTFNSEIPKEEINL